MTVDRPLGVATPRTHPRFIRMSSPPDAPMPSPRANWPVRILAHGEETGDDLSASTTPEERIEMVWDLSRRMWLLTGRPLPHTARKDLPVRIIHRA